MGGAHLNSRIDSGIQVCAPFVRKQEPIRYPPAGKSVKNLRILRGQAGPDNRDPKMLARKDATLPRVALILFDEIVSFGDDLAKMFRFQGRRANL